MYKNWRVWPPLGGRRKLNNCDSPIAAMLQCKMVEGTLSTMLVVLGARYCREYFEDVFSIVQISIISQNALKIKCASIVSVKRSMITCLVYHGDLVASPPHALALPVQNSVPGSTKACHCMLSQCCACSYSPQCQHC